MRARTEWPLSSWTRNIVDGSASTTSPSISIFSSLTATSRANRPFGWGFRVRTAAQTDVRAAAGHRSIRSSPKPGPQTQGREPHARTPGRAETPEGVRFAAAVGTSNPHASGHAHAGGEDARTLGEDRDGVLEMG